MLNRAATVGAALFLLLLGGCRTGDESLILVQGAMPAETDTLVGRLSDVHTETLAGWTFWRGRLDGHPVVISKTLKGGANVAAATALAADHYHPIAIVNQGTAGGHDPMLRVHDIVLGAEAVSLGAFKTEYRERGQGANPLEWTPLDLLASEGSAGLDPNARTMRRFRADERLLAAAERVTNAYQKGRVVTGVIGSSDVWNSEVDRIEQLHAKYGTAAEDMETASAAQIAAAFHVPFLGVRVLSNNITNGGVYDPKAALSCQEFVERIVDEYMEKP